MPALYPDQVRLAVAETALGFFEYSPDTGVGKFDQRVKDAFGISRPCQHVHELHACVHPDDLPHLRATLDALSFSDAESDYHLRYRSVGMDDHLQRNVSERGTAIFDSAVGRLVVGTIRDITAETTREQALRLARGDLVQLAEASIHDLQDPMRNLMLYLDLARSAAQNGNSNVCELVEEALANSHRLASMVSEVYDYASIYAAASGEALTSSNTAISKAILNLRPLTHGQDVHIEYDDLPDLPVEEPYLVQLFQHLLQNSFQYRKPNQPLFITIRAFRNLTHFVFRITDNGIGFNSEYAGRIFGMFKRLHSYYEIPGIGMGLTTCSRIVHVYGGEISADSRPGQGACITFTIPVQAIAA